MFSLLLVEVNCARLFRSAGDSGRYNGKMRTALTGVAKHGGLATRFYGD
jgi:hypothetical protein